MVFRRDALVSIGGQALGSITEDALTSMALVSAGFATMWVQQKPLPAASALHGKPAHVCCRRRVRLFGLQQARTTASCFLHAALRWVADNLLPARLLCRYLNERGLTYGMAPDDVSGVFQQRLRWAMGALQILLRANPLSNVSGHRGAASGRQGGA